MEIQIIMKVLAGALAGGVAGFFLGKAKSCSGKYCTAPTRQQAVRVFYVIATAVFGGGIAWFFIHR